MISQLSRGGWEGLTSPLPELWESRGLAGGCRAPQGQMCW